MSSRWLGRRRELRYYLRAQQTNWRARRNGPYVIAHCLLHFAFDHFQTKQFQKEVERRMRCVCCKISDGCKIWSATRGASRRFCAWSTRRGAALQKNLQRRRQQRYQRQGSGRTIRKRHDPDWQGSKAPLRLTSRLAGVVCWRSSVGGSQCRKRCCGLEPFVGANETLMKRTPAQRARSWFISSYPLLGALAASFDLIEDPNICNRMSVSIAAVHAEQRELYVNPTAGLTEWQCQFVMAHEFLHVGLQHEQRRQGRDSYLWNVACDYVINGWLVEMGVGEMPSQGLLHDQDLKGMSLKKFTTASLAICDVLESCERCVATSKVATC